MKNIRERRGKLRRVEIGNGLREFEQLIERGLHRRVVFQLRQRGDEPVEREHQTLGATGLEILRNGTVAEFIA